jgi:protein-disulfide isomerase
MIGAGGWRAMHGGRGMRRGRIATAAGMMLVLGLAGCGGTQVSLPSLAGGTSSAASSDAGATAVAVTTPDRMEGNPFQETSSLSLAGREVIANPSVADVMQPAGALSEMSLGRADAPITFIKYASMTCPYCRQFQIEAFPELKRQYIDTGKMRFILREFPIGFQSGLATIALRCVGDAQYFRAYDLLMRRQNAWVSQEVRPEPIVKVLSEVGLTSAKLESCRQDKALVAALDAVKQRGRTLGIVGTPNFFVNGRLVKSTLTLGDVRNIVDPLLAGAPAPGSGQRS